MWSIQAWVSIACSYYLVVLTILKNMSQWIIPYMKWKIKAMFENHQHPPTSYEYYGAPPPPRTPRRFVSPQWSERHKEQASATPHFQASHTEGRCSHGCELSLTTWVFAEFSWLSTNSDRNPRSGQSKKDAQEYAANHHYRYFQMTSCCGSPKLRLMFSHFTRSSHLSAWSNRPRSKLLSAHPGSIMWCLEKITLWIVGRI